MNDSELTDIFSIPEYYIRPPWPDEKKRLGWIGSTKIYRNNPWIWLIASGSPERICSGISLEPNTQKENESATIVLNVLPRWRQQDPVCRLIQTAADQAIQAGIKRLEYPTVPRDPCLEFFEQSKFSLLKEHDVWRIELELLHARLKRLQPLALRKLKASYPDICVLPAQKKHLKSINRIVKENNLEQGFEISIEQIQEPKPYVYNGEISSVVTIAGEVAATVLTKRKSERFAITDIRAVCPRWSHLSALLNILLMAQPVKTCLEWNIKELQFQGRIGKHDETINMAKRVGGKKITTLSIWSRTL